MSYEMVSKNTGKPVPCTYRENGKSHHNVKVDEDIRTMVAIISAMFSGENHRLDSADLNNFLNYNRITGYLPKLTLLDFYSKTLNLPQGLTVMSLVSLSTKNIDYSKAKENCKLYNLKTSKKVGEFDLDHVLINTYDSISDARRVLKISRSILDRRLKLSKKGIYVSLNNKIYKLINQIN
jgi:hypothetical protein